MGGGVVGGAGQVDGRSGEVAVGGGELGLAWDGGNSRNLRVVSLKTKDIASLPPSGGAA